MKYTLYITTSLDSDLMQTEKAEFDRVSQLEHWLEENRETLQLIELEEHLEEASKAVEKWPDWERMLL